MKNDTHPLAQKLESLLDQIATVLETEPEDDSPLREQLGKTALDHPAFAAIKLAADLSQPSYKEKGLSMMGAMYRLVDADLTSYVYNCDEVRHYLEENEPDYGTRAHQEWLTALKAINRLEQNANNELFERTQMYKSDLVAAEQTAKS
jgi:hypothetical protein